MATNILTAEQGIERIEHQLFVMEFKDHWTSADWSERMRLNARLAQLKG